MSGPKVVTIVTRQERIEACRTAIASTEHALSEWQRIMDRNMISAPTEFSRFQKEQQELERLLAADRFDAIEDSARRLTAEITTNVQEQLVHQSSQAAREQRQARSMQFSAQSVLARCIEDSFELQHEVRRVLEDAAVGQDIDVKAVQDAVSQALALIHADQEQSDTTAEEHKALAALLGATGGESNAADALKQAEDSLVGPQVRRIWSALAELTSNGAEDKAADFRQRLEKASAAEAEGHTERSALLMNSLEIDLAPALAHSREVQSVRDAIQIETAAARATNDLQFCEQKLVAAEQALNRGDHVAAQNYVEEAKSLRMARRSQRAAQSSRIAVLDGLKELGYEVREGMATQWAQKKQLIVRHPAKQGVALELAGTLDGGRLQARMVALQGAARDPHADKQTEEKWCKEFDSLQKYVAGRGAEVTVVKAVAAGTAPLKVVTGDHLEDERREQHPREKRLH